MTDNEQQRRCLQCGKPDHEGKCEPQLHTVREVSPPPEATSTPGDRHVSTNGIKAWGPFRDGRFLVNVGHADYTPAQAVRLATEIVECATAAARAQREHDAQQAVQRADEQISEYQRAVRDHFTPPV